MSKIFDAVRNGNRKPIWQAIGKTFDVNISVSDGLAEIDGDFHVTKAPMKTVVMKNGNKTLIDIPGRYCIIGDTVEGYKSFGECGESYRVVQRTDFARMLDDLTTRWPLETIGMTKNDAMLFVVLNAGIMEINGDPMQLYFMITDTIDGKTSAKSIFTPVRLHCSNALVSALRSSVVNASINHRMKFEADIAQTIGLAKMMVQSQLSTIAYFQRMADKIITPDQAMQIFENSYRAPAEPAKMGILHLIDESNDELSHIRREGVAAQKTFEYYTDRSIDMQQAAMELYTRINDECPNIAGTAYAAYNAVVELADWRDNEESSYVDALFGQRATEKKRAFDEALEVSNG